LTLLVLTLFPTGAGAIASDPPETPGPLDLVRVKVGQRETRLVTRISVASPLPKLTQLRYHPNLDSQRAQRYLCLNLASKSIGRKFLCPAGRIEHGRMKVGVSVVGRRSIRGAGSVQAKVHRKKRSLRLDFRLGALGIGPGKLNFAATTSWYGPACRPGPSRGAARCRDRAPNEGSAGTKVVPVRRVGCTGFHQGRVSSGPSRRKWVSLTFDDGPSVYTDDVLRILDRFGVHATFFQIGQQVPAYAALERRILAQGSELANHSWRHDDGPGQADLAHTNHVIEKASGFRPCMFRPPGGYLPSSTAAAASALHLVSVIWDVDTRDWTTPGSGAIHSVATSGGRGSIVLMHDGGGNRSQTVAALPGIIRSYKHRGYALKTMTQLLGGRYVLREDHGHHRHRAWTPPVERPRRPIRREGP